MGSAAAAPTSASTAWPAHPATPAATDAGVALVSASTASPSSSGGTRQTLDGSAAVAVTLPAAERDTATAAGGGTAWAGKDAGGPQSHSAAAAGINGPELGSSSSHRSSLPTDSCPGVNCPLLQSTTLPEGPPISDSQSSSEIGAEGANLAAGKLDAGAGVACAGLEGGGGLEAEVVCSALFCAGLAERCADLAVVSASHHLACRSLKQLAIAAGWCEEACEEPSGGRGTSTPGAGSSGFALGGASSAERDAGGSGVTSGGSVAAASATSAGGGDVGAACVQAPQLAGRGCALASCAAVETEQSPFRPVRRGTL